MAANWEQEPYCSIFILYIFKRTVEKPNNFNYDVIIHYFNVLMGSILTFYQLLSIKNVNQTKFYTLDLQTLWRHSGLLSTLRISRSPPCTTQHVSKRKRKGKRKRRRRCSAPTVGGWGQGSRGGLWVRLGSRPLATGGAVVLLYLQSSADCWRKCCADY